MAKKYAGTVNVVYQVYSHQPPVFVGKDRMGDDQYRANLIPVGQVAAYTSDDAWKQAHAMCSNPALEVIGNVH